MAMAAAPTTTTTTAAAAMLTDHQNVYKIARNNLMYSVAFNSNTHMHEGRKR